MTWVFDHTEVLTVAAIIGLLFFIIGGLSILASGKTREVSELQGFGIIKGEDIALLQAPVVFLDGTTDISWPDERVLGHLFRYDAQRGCYWEIK